MVAKPMTTLSTNMPSMENTNQLCSHFHSRVYCMGRINVPCKVPAKSTTTIPSTRFMKLLLFAGLVAGRGLAQGVQNLVHALICFRPVRVGSQRLALLGRERRCRHAHGDGLQNTVLFTQSHS